MDRGDAGLLLLLLMVAVVQCDVPDDDDDDDDDGHSCMPTYPTHSGDKTTGAQAWTQHRSHHSHASFQTFSVRSKYAYHGEIRVSGLRCGPRRTLPGTDDMIVIDYQNLAYLTDTLHLSMKFVEFSIPMHELE